MSDIAASEPVVATVKVFKPTIQGIITLANGQRLEFTGGGYPPRRLLGLPLMPDAPPSSGSG